MRHPASGGSVVVVGGSVAVVGGSVVVVGGSVVVVGGSVVVVVVQTGDELDEDELLLQLRRLLELLAALVSVAVVVVGVTAGGVSTGPVSPDRSAWVTAGSASNAGELSITWVAKADAAPMVSAVPVTPSTTGGRSRSGRTMRCFPM
jgi:hypothetical protein